MSSSVSINKHSHSESHGAAYRMISQQKAEREFRGHWSLMERPVWTEHHLIWLPINPAAVISTKTQHTENTKHLIEALLQKTKVSYDSYLVTFLSTGSP